MGYIAEGRSRVSVQQLRMVTWVVWDILLRGGAEYICTATTHGGHRYSICTATTHGVHSFQEETVHATSCRKEALAPRRVL